MSALDDVMALTRCDHGVPLDMWCRECKTDRKYDHIEDRLPRPMTLGPATVSEDPEEDGSMDDLVVRGGIESFHMERMAPGSWWAALYLTDGSRIALHVWRDGKSVNARWEHEA